MIVGIAMKRERARWFLVQDLLKMVETTKPEEGDSVCSLRGAIQITLVINQFWPPNLPSEECSLAASIEKIMHLEKDYCGRDLMGSSLTIPVGTFRAFGDRLSKMCSGVCLLCTKAGERDLSRCCEKAEHRVDMTVPTAMMEQGRAL